MNRCVGRGEGEADRSDLIQIGINVPEKVGSVHNLFKNTVRIVDIKISEF